MIARLLACLDFKMYGSVAAGLPGYRIVIVDVENGRNTASLLALNFCLRLLLGLLVLLLLAAVRFRLFSRLLKILLSPVVTINELVPVEIQMSKQPIVIPLWKSI